MDRLIAAEVFISIVERGSMIAAAQALGMSRAMVTRYLAQMEDWAGARLLHRTTRKLSLTAAGDETLSRCRQLLEITAHMAVSTSSSDEPQGLLRISCAQSLAQSVLAGAVSQYLRRYPQTAVDLQTSNHAVNLIEERIDLAVRITNALEPNLIARQLASCASVVTGPRSFASSSAWPTFSAATFADDGQEAQGIALMMRAAVETPGRTAALVTPDRATGTLYADVTVRDHIIVAQGKYLSMAEEGLL